MTLRLETPDRASGLLASLERSGYALLAGAVAAAPDGPGAAADWPRLREHWTRLPRDPYLKDGGRYRSRRHASLVHDVAAGELVAVPHRPHWQPTEYNALHGGMSRLFEPPEPGFLDDAGLRRCIAAVGAQVARLRGEARWFVEVHAFRIDTADGIGRPTPEGAHRDGVDFVAVWLVGRDAVRGGETRVFEADGPCGVRFTMTEPGSVLVLDDRRVVHETTPILPDARAGVRDTLVVTYRAGGFMAPG